METVCAGRAAWRTAASRAGPVSRGARPGPAQNRSCLSLVCGTSSPIWGFEPHAGQAAASHYLLVPFQQPVATAECVPTPLPTDEETLWGTDLISRLQGRLVLFGFWRKTSAKENS